MVIIMP